jgi:hypothetical protein
MDRKASKSYTRSASTAYLDEKQLLYVAAAQAARFTMARSTTRDGSRSSPRLKRVRARNTVADANGNAHVGASLGARMIVFPSPCE